MSSETGVNAKRHLSFVKIDTKDVILKTMVSDVNSFELAGNGEKILVVMGKNYHMLDAGTSKVSDLSKSEPSCCYAEVF